MVNNKIKTILGALVFITSTCFLTGCDGKPSADDCKEALNQYIETRSVNVKFPAEIIPDTDEFILAVPTDHPLTNNDTTLDNQRYKGDYGTNKYKEQYEHNRKVAEYLKDKGCLRIEETVVEFKARGLTSLPGARQTEKIAGLKITPTDKFRNLMSDSKDFFFKGKVFEIAKYSADKISEISPKPEIIGGFEYYNFKYTTKIAKQQDFVTPEFYELVKEDIVTKGDYNENNKASAHIAKKDGKWVVPKEDFFRKF
ncbi:hypothetical protein [Succinivibrio sp.]|uniref:hypothetical protein n=1 Tax=Succinivibrio sp. TaxID=2053619 RepID=UPI0025E2C1BE|nr:hypothetical protein [Succinivibrio sp.]MBQ9220865.1 hypothetical protein [Succinivibrio sp.]